MSITKRGLSFLACTILLCTMLPFSVFASPESESGPVDMVMYVYDARPAEFQALSDAYKELHPNVTVETIIPAADFFGSLTARIASNTMPDIVSDVFQYANDGATGDILLQEHLVAMKALDLQWDNSLDESEGSDYGTFINHFATEQVAMIQMGTWALNHVLGLNPDVTMRYAAVPYSENPDDARLSANIGVSLGVGTQTEHRDEAIQFLDWITSVEGNTVYSELFREIPVVTGVDVPLLPAAEDVLRYKETGAIVPWSQVLMSEAGRAEGSAIMQQYFLGEISAEQAIRGVYENWFK